MVQFEFDGSDLIDQHWLAFIFDLWPWLFRSTHIMVQFKLDGSDLIDKHWFVLTFDLASLGRPISNKVIPLYQVSWPYRSLSYILRYEFWSSMNSEWVTDIQTDRKWCTCMGAHRAIGTGGLKNGWSLMCTQMWCPPVLSPKRPSIISFHNISLHYYTLYIFHITCCAWGTPGHRSSLMQFQPVSSSNKGCN